MITEIDTFRLAASASVEDFIAADHARQVTFDNFQPGIRRRTTAKGAAGRWLVCTLWDAEASADAAAAASATDDAVLAAEALIDESTRTKERFEHLPG